MNWMDIFENFDFLMRGLVVTLKLASISIIGSLILGTILGILRYSRIFPFNIIATAFVEITRSIPLIIFIIFIHFGFLPYIFGTAVSFFQSACVALTIFTSAYIAEIIRGGLKSIEKGHIDAAKSLGLNYMQRLIYIVLPLAISRMTPALVSQFISLIKDTSLASTIGLIELTRAGQIVYERTYHEFEILIFVALIYFVVCYSLSSLSKKLESKPYIFYEASKVHKF
ncbi:MAG: amino acid ABC transporter permease [bacterium]